MNHVMNNHTLKKKKKNSDKEGAREQRKMARSGPRKLVESVIWTEFEGG